MKKIVLIFASIMMIPIIMVSQNSLVNVGNLHLIAKNTGNKVVLRWAPNKPGAWHLSMKYGYRLERLSYKDSIDFFKGEFKTIGVDSIKPWPLKDWEPIANEAANDKYATIAAQLIHGDNKEFEGDIFSKARKFKNLFGFAMLAADFSANAAKASGLRYDDVDIKPDYNYVYRVYSLVPDSLYQIDTAYVAVNARNIYKEVKIKLDPAVSQENAVELQWERSFNDYYTAYYIEKSTDGKTFKRLNEIPYIDARKDEKYFEEINAYLDSLEGNYIPYYYRIVGIDAFADLSSPSNVIKGMGRDVTPPPTPFNVKAKQLAEGKMQITWEQDECDDLKGFLISRRSEIDGPETAVASKILPKNTRSFIDENYNPLGSNWYLVYALDTANNYSKNWPQYGEVIDSIPPMPPQGIEGSIDTNGVVRIHWNLGKEIDLFGYSVLYANASDHVFINLTNKPLKDTFFVDTINLKTLTEHIYYKIIAFDYKRNASEYSEILDLKKPDIVPPVAPLFTYYDVTEKGIELKWANSSSHDAKTNSLYREIENTGDWKLIFKSPARENYGHFIDKNISAGTKYRYKLEAEDDDGLKSESDYILNLTSLDFSTPKAVSNFKTYYNNEKKYVELSWEYSQSGECTYVIYRSKGDSGYKIIKSLKQDTYKFYDKSIKPNESYDYTIKVVFPNGIKSDFSTVNKVKT